MTPCDHSRFEETAKNCHVCNLLNLAKQGVRRKQPEPEPGEGDTRGFDPPCVYRLEETGQVRCQCPSGQRKVMSYGCTQYGRCTLSIYQPADTRVKMCKLCERRAETLPVVDPIKAIKWSYAVTTVQERRLTLLPRTLASLWKAGFPDPLLSVDGGDLRVWAEYRYNVTVRKEKIYAYGNWWLTAHELFVREPEADFYAIFQDDVQFRPDLRLYLERVTWPGPGYINLYTFPENARRKNKVQGGFYSSNQAGLGALALIFRREEFVKLLQHWHMYKKLTPSPDPAKVHQRYKAIDGGVVEAFRQMKMTEYVHCPSLVQHLGWDTSTLDNSNPLADFKDGDKSALELLT